MSERPQVAVVCSRVRIEEKLIRDALEHAGATVDMVDDRALVLDIGRASHPWDVVVGRSLSAARGLAVLRVLAAAGVPVVNHPDTVALCADKLATTARLVEAGVPVPRTAVAFTEEAALRACEAIGYPVVLKPVTGSWGRLLARLNDRDAAEAVLEDRAVLGSPEHRVFYLQEHVAKPGRDIRAFVIDGEVVCAVYRESAHWITNTALGATTRDCPVTRELAALCRRAAQAVGGGALAVDILEDGARLLVSEVNATMEFRNSIDVTGVDMPGRLAAHVMSAARPRARVAMGA